MKKKIFARAALAAAAAAAVITAVSVSSGAQIRAQNAGDVSDFLSDCGLNVVYLSEKEVTIPSDFSAVYEKYNELQKAQGFDLSRHKGHSAVSYTFAVSGYINEGRRESHVQAHVLVCEGKVVAADVASTELDGFMRGVRQFDSK